MTHLLGGHRKVRSIILGQPECSLFVLAVPSRRAQWPTIKVTIKRRLAEDALKKTVEGDDASADQLAEKAKATNRGRWRMSFRTWMKTQVRSTIRKRSGKTLVATLTSNSTFESLHASLPQEGGGSVTADCAVDH
jgi:hypothetical protein